MFNFLRSIIGLSPRAEAAGVRIDSALEGIADTLEAVNLGLKQQFGLSQPPAIAAAPCVTQGDSEPETNGHAKRGKKAVV